VKLVAIDWQAWEYLLGEWDGGNVGDPGEGHGRFAFSFDLDRNILVRKSSTVYPDTPERPGFTHDDLIIVHVDNDAQMRAIYFDNEGHVIHYEVTVSSDRQTITLQSYPEPTIPQFRFTYIKTGKDTLDARFEMAPPGKPGAFFTYLEGTAKRLRGK
jgi:hypothetical protein